MFGQGRPPRSTYRSIPECAPQLQRFEQYGLGLFEGEVVPEAEADTHCTYRAEDSSQHSVFKHHMGSQSSFNVRTACSAAEGLVRSKIGVHPSFTYRSQAQEPGYLQIAE